MANITLRNGDVLSYYEASPPDQPDPLYFISTQPGVAAATVAISSTVYIGHLTKDLGATIEAEVSTLTKIIDSVSLDSSFAGQIGTYLESLNDEKERATIEVALLLATQDGGISGTSRTLLDAATGKAIKPENKRLAKQAALLLSMPGLAAINSTTPYEDPIKIIKGTYDAPVNFFNKVPGHAAFQRIKPEFLSELVPYVRLYKIVRTGTTEKEVEFRFDSTITRLDDIFGEISQRGTGVGLKSVDWQYDGSDPFTASRSIQVKVSLFFQNFKELNRDRGGYRYIDLLLPPGSPQGDKQTVADGVSAREFRPELTEIKLVAGWSNPGDNSLLASDESLKKSFDDLKTTFLLTLQDHDFNIRDDGTFDLSITYRGRLAGILEDPRANIYYHHELVDDLNKPVFEIIRLINECLQSKEISDEVKEKTRKTLAIYVQNIKKHLVSSLIEGLEKEGNIYSVAITSGKYYEVIKAIEDSAYYLKSDISFEKGEDYKLLWGFESNVREQFNDMMLSEDDKSLEKPSEKGMLEILYDWFKKSTNDPGAEQDTVEISMFSGENLEIQFFYLGDLIELVTKRVFHEKNTGAWTTSEYVNSLKRTNILLGSLEYKMSGAIHEINMADIPISLDYFMNWIQDNILDSQGINYSYLKFIQDISRELVTAVMGKDFLKGVLSQDLSPSKCFFSIPAHGTAGAWTNPLDSLKTKIDRDTVLDTTADAQAVATSESGDDLVYEDQEAGTSELIAEAPPPATELTGMDEIISERKSYLLENKDSKTTLMKGGSHSGPYYHYMFLFFEKKKPDLSKADIPKFHFGRDRGLLKTASFSKTDIEYLREQRVLSQMDDNYNPLFQLSNVYNLEMKMFGNNLFLPGSYVNFDPAGMDIPKDIASIMGLGGYHYVYKVNSYIEAGKFETTVSALWDSPSSSAEETASEDGKDTVDTPKPEVICNQDLLDILMVDLRKVEPIAIEEEEKVEDQAPPTSPGKTTEEMSETAVETRDRAAENLAEAPTAIASGFAAAASNIGEAFFGDEGETE